MPNLTSQLLAGYPFYRYTSPSIIQRGRQYYKEGRVTDIEIDNDESAVCTVAGGSDYTVEIQAIDDRGAINFTCDCPYAEDYICKHMVAAALAVSELLKITSEAPGKHSSIPEPQFTKKWTKKLESLLSEMPSSTRPGSNLQRYAVVIVMRKDRYGYPGNYSYTPMVIKAKEWPALQGQPHDNPNAINDLLLQNTEWLKYADTWYPQFNPAGCLNLSADGLKLLNLFNQFRRLVFNSSAWSDYFLLFAKYDIPIFITNEAQTTVLKRVEVLEEPSDIALFVKQQDGMVSCTAGFINKGFTGGEYPIEVISNDSSWLLLDRYMFSLRNPNQFRMLSNFPIRFPEADVEIFQSKYLARLASGFPIHGDMILHHAVLGAPVPRLYLRDDKAKRLIAELRFGYGACEVDASKDGQELSIQNQPGSWDLLHIQRQPEQEKEFYQLLTDARYGLKRSDTTQPHGTFEMRARTHPFDFLMHSIPLLTKAGFEIYGDENLKIGKINRSTPSLRVNIVSGIDWFDLQTVVEFGDQQISLQNVRKALKRGDNYIKLADGSVGQIPDEWLEKYKHLWNLAEETEGGYRISDFHLPLIDNLLEENTGIQIPADLAERRERLHSFERIKPQPIPQGFIGELRPYQKHGLDWLHFLREYNFGGILADDMGLGKTIQVLAYLQSLKEQGLAVSAALLVVPKSLIVNWLRESEKFTPGLRFLEYLGMSREKDTSSFDQYDVILTTYGTMLRDIDLLHSYKFHHVILDESQAIKNPLAKSAKAATILNAEHRLVMTGTPVENNTFELWSQFAFLNPGLLGSMDYFKREFATPIESRQDEQSAVTLRKLVYPFILRRIKEQVAPELPPRTERVVYVDMDTAQKKLYNQTKDRYRAELLGIIESEGMNDARFKILEGLLRLRQIAIHPALVDKNYKGDAPKFEMLLETLGTLRSEHHKALIFSQFVETLKLVRQELDKQKIKYEYLDGKTRDRQSHVDQFQNDPETSFFLISLKAGGVGFNLTAADYILHLDPWWNPAVEMQASDRAHRIGQEKPVFVYKLITRGSVEEKILLLQEKKRALVKSLITTEGSFFKSLTREDVKQLFE